MRRLFFASALVLIVLALVHPAAASPAAAANELQLSVHTGYDGMVRPGTWMPVEVSLANAGANVTGKVQLSVMRRPAGTNTTIGASVDYVVPITVPEHSSKRFTTAIYVPPFFDQLSVRLLSGQQTLLQQDVFLQRVDASQVFCGVLASDPTAFDSLSGLTVGDSKRQPHLVSLDLPDLPTNPQVLGTLDCLIITDYSTRGLSTLQQSALTSWVDNGGVLVVGTGPNGPSTLAGLPADLLPATMNGTTSLRSLTGLATFFEGASNPTGPWLMATLKVGDGAALASDENQPLVVVGRRGKGTVFMFALSPAQPPFRGWDGADRVWSYMLSYTSLAPTLFSTGSRQEFGWGRVPREALTQGGAGLGPESLLLLGGLIFFAVVIGPLNVLILSRLGRRDLALVTIPVLSILSTLGAVVYANNHRQGDVMVNQVSLVRTWDGTGIGQLHSFVGVFALHSQHFPVMVPANSLMSTTVYPFQGQFARTVPNVKVLQTDSPEEQGLDVEPGALNSFILDGHLHSDGKIISSIQLENDQLVGQITNGLPITIRDAAIVAGNSVQSIGELKPGASHAVALPVGGGSPVGFQDNGQVIDKLFPGTSHETGAHHDVRYDILSAALNPSQTFSGQVELSGLNLIGWLGDSVDPVTASDTGRQSHQQTVFITNLAVHLPTSLQTIPSQIIERQSLLTSSSARTDANGVAINTGDSAAFQFTAPIDPGHFALRSMTLVTASDNDPSGVLEFFNWRTQVWDTISFAPGNLAIPTPDRYFSPTGLVRLRFRYKSAPAPMGASTLTFNKFQLLIGGVGR